MEIALNSPHAAELVKARTALMTVIDPELFVNIIDLGLVYEVRFPSVGVIEVIMTLSTPHCPLGDAITGGVKNALNLAFPDQFIQVELVWDPPWGLDRITEEGKRQLGLKD
ncbi:MAG TPA: metal-sulfur cluster assembly factor [Sphingobacteriaceae bacterium]|nr:metal-sulfur cluster assembly factor [Sphingobacteriaceae bacterium]